MSGKKHKAWRWVAKLMGGEVTKAVKRELYADPTLSKKMVKDWRGRTKND